MFASHGAENWIMYVCVCVCVCDDADDNEVRGCRKVLAGKGRLYNLPGMIYSENVFVLIVIDLVYSDYI